MRRRAPITAALLALTLTAIEGQEISSPQKIRGLDDPLWLDLGTLLEEAGRVELSAAGPYPDSRVRAELENLDLGSLSAAGREAAARISAALGPEAPARPFAATAGLELNPSWAWRSDRALSWDRGYADRFPALRLPLELAIGLRFYGYSELALREDPDLVAALPGPGNGFNVAELFAAPEGADGTFPFRAFGSLGGPWWNLSLGRDRLDFGGEGAYDLGLSAAAEYYDFARLELGDRDFLYTAMAIQLNPQRNIYLHRADWRPLASLSLSMSEMLLVGEAPPEIRYLNPFMIFHGFEPWHDYGPARPTPTGTASELGLSLDWAPLAGLRLSAQYAMTQLEEPFKAAFWPQAASTIPNGEGYLANLSYRRPFNAFYATVDLRAAYTTPMLYLLSGAAGSSGPSGIAENPTSWIYDRPDFSNFSPRTGRSKAWIGFGPGPDTELLALSLGLERGSMAAFGLEAEWMARGEYSEIENSLLDIVDWPDNPSLATLRTPSGIAEYSLRIGALGRLALPSPGLGIRLGLEGALNWISLRNAEHLPGEAKQGWEIYAGLQLRAH